MVVVFKGAHGWITLELNKCYVITYFAVLCYHIIVVFKRIVMRTSFFTLLMSIFFAAQLSAAPRVITDIAPVHGLVSRVMVGVGTPGLIVPPGSSPHDFSFTPSNARELADSTVVFWVGEALAPWLQKTISSISKNALSVELLPSDPSLLLPVRSGGGHQHSNDSHQHSNEEYDPHAWLDPFIACQWLNVIAKKLAEVDPQNAQKYLFNAKVGQAEIKGVTAKVGAKLLSPSTVPFVAYHDAYRYLDRRFGLKFLGAFADSDATPPSARRAANLSQKIRERPEICVITEPQYSSNFLQMVSTGSDVRHAVIDPLGSNIPIGPNFYTSFLTMIGNTLSSCIRTSNQSTSKSTK